MENDMQELLKSAFDLMEVLHKRWKKTETPFGRISFCGFSWGGREHVCIWRHGNQHVEIRRVGDRYRSDATADAIFLLNRNLAAMSQYFASDEFQKKVKGSVSLVKRIKKALDG